MLTLKVENDSAEIELPKDAGKVRVDFAKLSPEVIGRMLVHGATQKIADLAAGVFVKADMKREPKESDTVFDSADALNAYLREQSAKMVEAWYAGAWTVGRASIPRDPVMVETFAIIFAALSVKPADMPKWRKEGIRAAVLALAKAKIGKPIPPKREDAVFESVFTQLQEKAKAAIEARAKAADLDITL